MTTTPPPSSAAAPLPEPSTSAPPPEVQRVEWLFRHCTQAGVVNPLMHLVLQYRMNKP